MPLNGFDNLHNLDKHKKRKSSSLLESFLLILLGTLELAILDRDGWSFSKNFENFEKFSLMFSVKASVKKMF